MPSWKKILQSGSAVHVLNITASGLPNSFQPNIIGYDTTSGRFTYFSTSSLVNGGSVIGGSGTTNYITRWSGPNTITTSSMYESSSRIGIGTGAVLPNAVLHISGASNDNLLTVSSPTATNALFISGSGRVGIGTTTPTTTLDVLGSINATGFVASANVFTNVVRGYRTASFGAPGIDFPTTAVVHISGASNDNLLRVSSPTDQNILFVSGSGNVGIGTTSSLARLHVNPASTPNLITSLFTIGHSDNNFKAGFANGSGSTTDSEHAKVGMWFNPTVNSTDNPVTHIGFLRGNSANSSGMTFNVNNTETMRISDSGNVGIGTTSPAAKLEVLNSFTVSASSGQFADVKFRNLSESFRNHVLTYDELTGQIYYVTSSLVGDFSCITPLPDIQVNNALYYSPSPPSASHFDNYGWADAYWGCSGSVNLQAINNAANNYTLTYQWYNDSATPPTNLILNATESIYYPTASGWYQVKITDDTCFEYSSPYAVGFLPQDNFVTGSALGTADQTINLGDPIEPIFWNITTNTYADFDSAFQNQYSYNPSVISATLPPGINSTVGQNFSSGSGLIILTGIPTETGSFYYSLFLDQPGCSTGPNPYAYGVITVISASCYTPSIQAGPTGRREVCQNLPFPMACNSQVSNHINPLTYQWYISESFGYNPTPITNATSSTFFTTASGYFSVQICDGACCDTLYNFLEIVRTPSGSIILDSGNNIQSHHAGTAISPIHYTTTGNITNADLLNAPPGINLTYGVNSITMSGVLSYLPGNILQTFNYTIRQLDGCIPQGGGGLSLPAEVSGSIQVQPGVQYQISGSFKYDNTAGTPMTNSKIYLYTTASAGLPIGARVKEVNTDGNGNYIMDISFVSFAYNPALGVNQFNGPLPSGEYYMVGSTNKPWGGVTATDALVINRSTIGAAPLVGLRLKAADVNGSNTTTSVDALLVARRTNGGISAFAAGNWAYNTQSFVWDTNNPTPININLKALCVGDANGSYQPNTAL